MVHLPGNTRTGTTINTDVNTKNPLNVVNLSQHTLTEAEKSLLSRGLSFCPTAKLDTVELCQNTENFLRKVRLTEYFKDSDSITDRPDYMPPKPSQWTPPVGRNPHIDSFVNQVRGHLENFLQSTQRPAPDNLSLHEHKALHDLKNNDIVTRQADKGGAITLLDRDAYVREASTQLSNKDFYIQVDSDPTETYHRELMSLVKTFNNAETQELVLSLIPPLLQAGTFYTIPILHKLVPPGRPIISGKGTLTEYISGFIDSILQRLMPHIPSYLQDTTDFLNKLATIETVPDNSLLVTMDVTSLYTNIPHDDGVRACGKFLDSFPVNHIPTEVICSLISFILTHNSFVFNDKCYVQVSGTAMRTRMLIETQFIDKSSFEPLFYVRFIDDIFLVWTHGRPSLDDFIHDPNFTHPSIKFTVEISAKKVPFLDVMVSLTQSGLKISLYRKPTDRPTYLNYSSFHPSHIKRSIIFSQLLRFKRICSDHADYEKAVRHLVQSLLECGYPYKLISKEINRASHLSRDSVLSQKRNDLTAQPQRIPFVT
ncbi:hypothetical protein HOLleu_32855 [Holothuria leucospilota]|uniref:Helix-turn-helix domain-containing protein n=1 Tax=Holothuria leucospilota TaxID=206669 RepID=A0A9Q1BJA9_HOLLE|nr:hypothetical protein HOLleu_32855 [Holothuria leucospilota]